MANEKHCESKPIFDSSMSCDHVPPNYIHDIKKHDLPPEPEGGVLDVIAEFKRMMGAIRCELDFEYDKGRIKGADYALMIEKLVDPIMGRAISYTIEFSKTELEVMMLQHQLNVAGDLHRMEMDLKLLDIVHKEAQTHLTRAQEMTEKAQADMICAQEVKLETEIMKLTAELDHECELIGKTKNEALKVAEETELIVEQKSELTKNGTSERALKSAQTTTQGAQATLYNRQTTGFNDKARNDASKILQDTWAVKAVEEPDKAYGDGDTTAIAALGRSASM